LAQGSVQLVVPHGRCRAGSVSSKFAHRLCVQTRKYSKR
jgi:hypothetical protein